uniref:Metalloendopeptidase n=1 Tax=Pachycerianthus borealis TaxID=2736680 RepID=A0A7G7WYP9_9CNID|nr:toxin candidate TRINITY_DN27795_c0_g1_i1 [Pachycerianthus borealis]
MKDAILLLLVFMAASLQFSQAAGPEEGMLFEGDIILTKQQKNILDREISENKRGALIGNRWPGRVVPYIFDSTISSSSTAVSVIQNAMAIWSSVTCVTFVPRTIEVGFVEFYKGIGCSSNIGYTGSLQRINLAEGCWNTGIVLHEIGHSLGFFHEQSRQDRDDYVKINWENIMSGYEGNFKKYPTYIYSYGEPYDYASIMHYGNKYFSSNGLNTVDTIPVAGIEIGQRNSLSDNDIKQMNLMYDCANCVCPTGWIKHNSNCYYFSTSTEVETSWSSAQQNCANQDAELLCLLDFDELLFIWEQINSSGSMYWTGPNDVTVEGTWTCAITPYYIYWGWGRPLTTTVNQDCGVLKYNGYHYDEACTGTVTRRFICKKLCPLNG